MPRLRLFTLALIGLFAVPAFASPLPFSKDKVLVAVGDRGVFDLDADGRLRAAAPSVEAVLLRHGLTHFARIGSDRIVAPGRIPRFFSLQSPRAEFDPLAAARELRATGLFLAVAPDIHVRLDATLPNDPYLAQQWYVRSASGADIHLPEAWDVTKGSTSVVIGIMDTGVDMTHPDLASQIWTNPGEIPGNGIDDDGNGLVDDIHGWDFGNNDNDPNPHAVFDPSGLDVGFHGTFVAGIAAAATDNGDGIAGAGWRCRIMPLKVVDSAGDITLDAVTAAIQYAALMHVDVLNMSFGAPGDSVEAYFKALVDLATAAGVVCVASAGNDDTSTPSYPAASEGVIGVAATDESDARASFSNWGSWVKVAAPGSAMWSSICQNYAIDEISQLYYYFLFGWDGTNPYMSGDGTSFASPLVAGVCGLIRSQFPTLSPQAVARVLVENGDPIAYDQPIGPKVNAFRSVQLPVAAVAPTIPTSIELAIVGANPFVAATAIRFSLPQAGPVRLTLFDCSGRAVRDLVRADLPAGEHRVAWNADDDAGHTLASGIYFARLQSAGHSARCRLVLIH